MVPSFIARLVNWLLALVKNLFDSFVILLKDLGAWVLDICFDLIDLVMQGFDGVLPDNPFQSYWNGLPGEVTGMAVAIGLPEAMGIIVMAITVRFLLQLVPFVRWGS